jgi:hypothetical protein
MGGLRNAPESRRIVERLVPLEIDSLIATILAAEKRITDSVGWKSIGRADYSSSTLRVVCPPEPKAVLRLVMTVERRHLPQKSSFNLLLGDKRIFSLDVNPRRCHTNRRTLGTVGVTHWHTWPCEEAEPDDRAMSHKEWFWEFLQRSKTAFTGRYRKPPYEPEQLRML